VTPDTQSIHSDKNREQIQLMQQALDIMKNTPADKLNLAPVAAALFKIKGKAYSMGKHKAFESMFSMGLPRRALWKCGRQLGKSQNLSGSRLIMGLMRAYYNILFVCPRFSQVKRISNQYIRPLLSSTEYEDTYLLDKFGEQTTLQRTLMNDTILFFSFALLDPDRIRSIFASEIVVDESVVGDTEIMPGKCIKDLRSGDVVDSFDKEGHIMDSVLAKDPSYHGKRPCFRVGTVSGKTLEGTADHLVPTNRGWMHIGEIIDHVMGVNMHIIKDPAAYASADNTYVSQPCPGEVPDIIRVLHPSTRDAEDARLFRALSSRVYAISSDFALFSKPDEITPETSRAALQADPVAWVEYTGVKDVYDIEIVGTNTYFANGIASHNCQDMNWDFIPVIAEVLSGSEVHRNQRFSGTPKTLDNTAEKLWQQTSMAECAMRCPRCGHWNIACVDYDLLDMIQEAGPSCSKCKRLLDPMNSCWIHRKPDLMNTFVGYHVSQVTHVYHYGNPQNWAELLYKKRNYPTWRFFNECLGESYESSTRLVNLHELQAACRRDRVNEAGAAAQVSVRAKMSALGIDWGGGGEDSKSSTTITLATLSGEIGECLYLERIPPTVGIQEQIQRVMQLVTRFAPTFVAHDYNGEGAAREVLLIQAGIPINRLVPFSYGVSAKSAIVSYSKNKKGYRSCYFLDKPRSLTTLCHMIKGGKVTFPRYDTLTSTGGTGKVGLGDTNHLDDFLNLVEDRRNNPRGTDIVLVSKVAGTFDDFAHSTNFALTALWFSSGAYPNISEALNIQMSEEDYARIYGNGKW